MRVDWDVISGIAQITWSIIGVFVLPWVRAISRDIHDLKKFMERSAEQHSQTNRTVRRHGIRIRRLEKRRLPGDDQ